MTAAAPSAPWPRTHARPTVTATTWRNRHHGPLDRLRDRERTQPPSRGSRPRVPCAGSGRTDRVAPDGCERVTLILGTRQIAALIDEIDVIAAVEAIHADLGSGRMEQPAPPTLA